MFSKEKLNGYLSVASKYVDVTKEKIDSEIQNNEDLKKLVNTYKDSYKEVIEAAKNREPSIKKEKPRGIKSNSAFSLSGEKKYTPSEFATSQGTNILFISSLGIRGVGLTFKGYINKLTIDFSQSELLSYTVEHGTNAFNSYDEINLNFDCNSQDISVGFIVYKRENLKKLVDCIFSNCELSSDVKPLKDILEQNIYLEAEKLGSKNLFIDAINLLHTIPENSIKYGDAISRIEFYVKKRQDRTLKHSGRQVEITHYIVLQNISSPHLDTIYGTIFAVKVLMTNTSKSEGNFQFSQFSLIDENGCSYDELTDFTYTAWRKDQGYRMRAESYYPGETRQDIICFRISPTASRFTLTWKGQEVKI